MLNSTSNKRRVKKLSNLLLLILIQVQIHVVHSQSATPCPRAQFPIVFGSTSGDAFFNAIDYNAATGRLVGAGDTADANLKGDSSSLQRPTVVMYTNGLTLPFIYSWGISLTLASNYFQGIALSSDGSYVIGHTCQGSGTVSYIIILNSNDGSIADSRSYSYNQNYDRDFRNLLVSQDSPPVAYLNPRTTTAGYQLLAYQFTTGFTSTPLWALQQPSSGAGATPRSLGLIFSPNSQSYLYAFNKHGSTYFVSSITSATGAINWSMQFTGSTDALSALMQARLISTEKIIFACIQYSTSGTGSYCARIVLDSSGTVDMTQSNLLLRDTINVGLVLRAMYITSKYEIKMVAYGTMNSLPRSTVLITYNIQTLAGTYKFTLPTMDTATTFQTLGNWVTSTLFIVSAPTKNLQTTDISSVSIGGGSFKAGVIFGSTTTDSCYAFSSIGNFAVTLSYSANTVATATATHFTTHSGVTFTQDTSTTVNQIVTASIPSIDANCLKGAYTWGTYTPPAQLTYTMKVGSTLTFPMATLPTATKQCSVSNPSDPVTYTGQLYYYLVNSNKGPEWSSTLFTVNSGNSGNIVATSANPIGTYQVRLIGQVKNSFEIYFMTYTITVVDNKAPVFSVYPQDTTVVRFQTAQVKFSVSDPDYDPLTLTYNEQGYPVLPSFISYSESGSDRIFTLSPVASTDLLTYTIVVKASDGYLATSTTFKVTVQDMQITSPVVSNVVSSLGNIGPPYFETELETQTVEPGKTATYYLPAILDPDANDLYSMSVTLGSTLPFTTVNEATETLVFKPLLTHAQDSPYTIKIKLTDDNPSPKYTTYSFNVLVPPPPVPAPAPPADAAAQDNSTAGNNSSSSDSNNSSTSGESGTGTTQSSTGLGSALNSGTSSTPKTVVQLTPQQIKQKLNSGEYRRSQASLRILKVNQKGQVMLRVHSDSMLDYMIVRIMNETDFELRIATQENKKVPFQIIGKDENAATVQVQMQFEDPSKISASVEVDQIELNTLKDIVATTGGGRLLASYGPQKVITILTKGQQLKRAIPPQVSFGSLNTVESMQAGSQLAGLVVLPGTIAFNIFLGAFMHFLWDLLNDLSFIMILAFISIGVPGLVSIIQQTFLTFIYMDLLQTDKWLPQLFYNADEEDEPLNDYFDINGFSSKSVIKNLGSTFVFLAVFILMHFIVMILKICEECLDCCHRQRAYLQSKMYWSASIRFFLQQFTPLAQASIINLYDIRFETTGDTISTCIAFAVVIFIPLILIVILVFLRKATKSGAIANEKEFSERYGGLTDGQNIRTAIGIYWNVIIIVRWIVTILVIVMLREFSSLQILSLLIVSKIFLVLLVFGKPFEELREIKFSIFNELMVSLYLYIMMCLTDFSYNPYQPDYHLEFRQILAVFLLGVIFLTVLVNLTKTIILIIKECLQKRRISQLKKQHQTKYQDQQTQQKIDKVIDQMLDQTEATKVLNAIDEKNKQIILNNVAQDLSLRQDPSKVIKIHQDFQISSNIRLEKTQDLAIKIPSRALTFHNFNNKDRDFESTSGSQQQLFTVEQMVKEEPHLQFEDHVHQQGVDNSHKFQENQESQFDTIQDPIPLEKVSRRLPPYVPQQNQVLVKMQNNIRQRVMRAQDVIGKKIKKQQTQIDKEQESYWKDQ